MLRGRGPIRDRLFKSDSYSVTIPLATTIFKFVTVAPVLTSYTQGSSVNLKITIQNTGNTSGAFNATITDADTGGYITGFGDTIAAGASKAYTTLVGTMPAHDWHLTIAVTP